VKEAYKEAGVEEVKGSSKIRNRKKKEIIDFIKNNPKATQRDLNSNCRTHVQSLFKGGIYEAYKRAKVSYPYERIKVYGVVIKDIKRRAREFEDRIVLKLSGYGKVNRLVKSKRGFADAVLERKGKKAIVEIKDYQSHKISLSEAKQLNKYLEDFECKLGFLVCSKKPKKDKFLIGNNRIYVLEESELKNIPSIIEGLS